MKKKIVSILIILIVVLQVTVLFTPNSYKESTQSFPGINNHPIHPLNNSKPSIGIFYDARYTEPWNFNAQQLTINLNQTLKTYNLTVEILNSTMLRNFMEQNPFGIVIITMGLAPDTIWNGSTNSFVEEWLDNGGIMIWTGCEEFYWVGTDGGINIPIGHVGSSYVLDMNYLITLSNHFITPTSLGLDLINNFSSHSSDVFCSISILTAENVYFEVYAQDGDYADPVLFQPQDGKGYFIRIHADYNDKLPIVNLSTWISSYIFNRFFKMPIVTEIETITSIFFLSTKQICINITNFSDYFKFIHINASSNVFLPISSSLMISPSELRNLNLTITPLNSARFQFYDFQINVFSNYTNSQNESVLIRFYSKRLSILINVPVVIAVLEIEPVMYPGGTYWLSLNILKFINNSISINIVLICDGCFNELKKNILLEENNSNIQIPLSIQIMAKEGDYKLILRAYQNNILLSSSELAIQVNSIFNNPYVLIIVILLLIVGISLVLIYYNQKKKIVHTEEKKLELEDQKSSRNTKTSNNQKRETGK